MTREEIIHMFHEAGAAAGWKPGLGNALVINYLTHFAALVAAAEREACARLEDEPGIYSRFDMASAIRARSNK